MSFALRVFVLLLKLLTVVKRGYRNLIYPKRYVKVRYHGGSYTKIPISIIDHCLPDYCIDGNGFHGVDIYPRGIVRHFSARRRFVYANSQMPRCISQRVRSCSPWTSRSAETLQNTATDGQTDTQTNRKTDRHTQPPADYTKHWHGEEKLSAGGDLLTDWDRVDRL